MANVSITKVENEDVCNAVKKGLEQIGFDITGIKSVLIKPNFLNDLDSRHGVTTDIRIIEALVKILKEKGVEKITIGEKTGAGSTTELFKKLGVDALEKQDVKLIDFDKDEYVKVELPNGMVLKEFRLPKSVLEADLIISAAKIKTHALTTVTLSIKNLFGFLKTSDRKKSHVLGLSEALVDIYSYLLSNKKKIIAVVDGIYALSGPLGPSIGKPIKMDLIVCGDNLVATDKVCTRLMRYNPEKVRHIVLAEKLGDIGDINVLGEKIDKVSTKFSMPSSLSPILERWLSKPFKKKPYMAFPEKCTACKKCMQACPMNAIVILEKGKAKIDRKKCISCLCCVEMCENGALKYRMSFPFDLLYNVYKSLKV